MTSPSAYASSNDSSHQLDCPRLAEQPRKPLRAAGAGQHTEHHFGQPDPAGVFPGNSDVGGERHLESTADRVPVQRRDDELRRVLEPEQRLVRVQAEVVLELGIRLLEHSDVGAGAEELLTRPAEHDDVDRRVHARGEDGRVDLEHHLVGIGVRRRIVQLDRRDAIRDADAYLLKRHDTSRPAIRVSPLPYASVLTYS